MTDLNKEREAFLNTFQYYKGRRDIIFSNEHELFMTRSNNPSEIAQKEISNMNSRWDAWLRCAKHRDAELEKAKAQAVQQSFEIGRLQDRITELLDERQDLYAQINNDQAVPEGYVLVPKEPTEVMERAGFDKGAGFLANSIYKAMVEASESGAEG
ncbi:hypothetical protein [Acinetobacter baumannii]|uniref:hypothetical protein n=1 Tax=Acinetobacter baumannii TaxID=470 RepID=UPI0029416633|nr:hypothetical protein [Acinetobacter baumannii]MDV4308945.1 hypothetical protein [Acinetobacter baumannii]